MHVAAFYAHRLFRISRVILIPKRQIVDGNALVDAVDAADVRPFQNHRRKSVCRIAQATPVVAVRRPGPSAEEIRQPRVNVF